MNNDPSDVRASDDPESLAWEGSPPAEQAPPRRLRRRIMLAAGVVLAAGVAALAVGLSGGGGGAGAAKRVVLAADVTTKQPGVKYTLSMSGDLAGHDFDVDSSGALNFGPPLSGSMDFELGSISAHELLVDGAYYVQLSTAPGHWLKVDASSIFGAMGESSSTLSIGGDPTQTLELLRAAGSVENQGEETIAGVSTTHYHAVVDLARVAAGLAGSERAAVDQNARGAERLLGSDSLPLDVWIDAQNLVRQVELTLSISTRVGTLAEKIKMDFPDYGQQPSVSAPPPGEVTDLSGRASANVARLRQQLGLGSG
jgi:hypothetical protein